VAEGGADGDVDGITKSASGQDGVGWLLHVKGAAVGVYDLDARAFGLGRGGAAQEKRRVFGTIRRVLYDGARDGFVDDAVVDQIVAAAHDGIWFRECVPLLQEEVDAGR
jgi:hypothetical protein